MRIVIQRVTEASVTINGQLHSTIGLGLIFFVSWSFSTRLQRVTAANERLSSELGIARQIQSSVLNRRVPPYLGAILRPAREVGGDFYDFQEKDGVLYFAIGDASGKGIPAALFTFLAGAGFRMSADMGLPPDEIVSRINALLCKDNDTCMFVTMFVGRLELAAGKLEYCNAGHPPLIVVRPDGKSEPLASKRNIAAGVAEGYVYPKQTATFDPGTRLLVYTDGVTEAHNAGKEMFGENRLTETLNRDPDAGPEELIRRMYGAADGFAAGAPQFDDITMLCLKYRGTAQ